MLNKLKDLSAFKFLIIGGISTAIDFCIYMIISNYIDITISKLISMTIASVFSFIFNKNWTFINKEKTSVIMALKYILAQIINIGVNTGINTLVYNLTKVKIIAFIIATGIAMVVNYLLQKIVVFNGGKK